MPCGAVRRSRSGTCSPDFSATSASSWLSVRSRSACGILAAIVIIAIVGVSVGGAVFLGAEPNAEEIAGMGMTIVLAVLVALAITIPLYMFLWFAGPLIVLRDMEVGTALKTSFSACLKNILPFIVWSVMVLVLAIPATIPIFLGWFLLGPVLMVSIYTGYRDIFHET